MQQEEMLVGGRMQGWSSVVTHSSVCNINGYGLSVGVCVCAQVTVFVGQCMQGVSILCVCLCRV